MGLTRVARFSPLDATISSSRGGKRAGIHHSPGSLDEALHTPEADQKLLLAGEVFSEELIEQWVSFKRAEAYYPVRNRPHPYELCLYCDV